MASDPVCEPEGVLRYLYIPTRPLYRINDKDQRTPCLTDVKKMNEECEEDAQREPSLGRNFKALCVSLVHMPLLRFMLCSLFMTGIFCNVIPQLVSSFFSSLIPSVRVGPIF